MICGQCVCVCARACVRARACDSRRYHRTYMHMCKNKELTKLSADSPAILAHSSNLVELALNSQRSE